MLKANIDSAKVVVKAHWSSEGSVFAGTISSTCHSVEVVTEIESEDDPALIAALVKNAQGGCYADSALTEPVTVHRSTMLNGTELDPADYPRKAPRRR